MMSLYTQEDICDGCVFAEWYSSKSLSRDVFLECTADLAEHVNYASGECPHKKEKKIQVHTTSSD